MIKIRKSVLYFVIGFLVISLLLNFLFLYQNLERNRVVKVVDGDSFSLADGRRVRLLGIDSPEKDKCMYKEARERLSGLLLGRHVRLKNIITDDYGRLLANVIVEDFPTWIKYMRYWAGKNFLGRENKEEFAKIDPMANRVIVREGLAKFVYVKSPYYEELKQAGQEAKDSQRGIYSSVCRTQSPNVDCLIKGNIREEGEKIYHLTDCPNYDQVIIDESFGDRWFCMEKEAEAAGFRKADGCK